ncbi:MAG TPA: hypothetical protein VGR73_14925 [Bryobacteraceae bacterium]|nr:hypothetical protein [Bryobacteraceae bacterium]
MADETKETPGKGTASDRDVLSNKDFQAVLKALLAAYQPVLKKELDLAGNPAELTKEAEAGPPNCADEIARANQIFGNFFTPEVALAMLPAEARTVLGPLEQWRWCLQHIRCCIIFGWLVCRGPRNFRAFSYYLYEYWICVRQILGTPVSSPPTPQERADFGVLVEELAGAFKPYLTDQLATVEFAAGIPDEVIGGAIDCREGLEEACQIFDRLLTPRAAEALLGKDAFTSHSKEPSFWFCRCWCLCAICFGCCLARARSLRDVVWCLIYFFRCLRRCFGPLTCNLTAPQGCVAEVANPALGAYTVEVHGTASGGSFNHYILEWSSDGINYNATDFIYPPLPPGNPGPGTIPVFNGLLADFNTTYKNPGLYYIRMTVFSNTQAQAPCNIEFQLFKKDVRILGVDNYFTLDTGWTDPAAKFVENVPALCSRPASVSEVSFGDCLSVQGGAWVGGCSGDKIKSYFLHYKPGFESNCASGGWTQFWEVDYVTPGQYRFINMRTGTSYLTATWGPDCFIPSLASLCAPFTNPEPNSLLYPSCWQSNIGGCLLNGLYTFRLTVLDTNGVTYCDTQTLWIDNKYPCAAIRIDAVPKCADLFVSNFAHPPDCSNPWPLPLSGIAFDPLIDELALPTRPNDNFDYYFVEVEKQGGPTVQIPIPGAAFDPMHPCFFGTSRVGDPLHHCATSVCDPNALDPAAIFGTLANFDLRAVDPICSKSVLWGPIDPNFTIPRGQCCVYVFKVWVYDRTIRPGGQHSVYGYGDWPVKICNDLSS